MNSLVILFVLPLLAGQKPSSPETPRAVQRRDTSQIRTADDLIDQLEARAAAARGLEIRSRFVADAQNSGEILERMYAEGRIEVSRQGTLWDRTWGVWLGPERRCTTVNSCRHLYTPEGLTLWDRDAGAFSNRRYLPRLKTKPRAAAWESAPTADPWFSRDHATTADGIDALTLYALLPKTLFGVETERNLTETEESWTLECKRQWNWGPVTKQFTVRKSDLAITRLQADRKTSRSNYRHIFKARKFIDIRGFRMPVRVWGRFYAFPKFMTWTYSVVRDGADLPRRSRADFREDKFAPIRLGDREKAQLKAMLEPNDPGMLLEFAFSTFPRRRGWHYRYRYERKNNRWMLERLREVDPGSSLAREEWLARTWKADDPKLAGMVKDAPRPLYNHATLLVESGKGAEAEKIAREGLKTAEDTGMKVLWTRLLVTCLAAQKGGEDPTPLWLDLARDFKDPVTQLFLAEYALGGGLTNHFEPGTLASRLDEPAAMLALLDRGSEEQFLEAVDRAAQVPLFRPMVAELAARRAEKPFKSPKAALAMATRLSKVQDVDALLAAAVLAKIAEKDDSKRWETALELWEEKARFDPDDWSWARMTLRMLHVFGKLAPDELHTRLAERFILRLREAKVGYWVGYYRWGEPVAEALLPLLERGEEKRFIELAAKASSAGWRIARTLEKAEKQFPFEEAIAHLRQSRDADEAHAWIRIANSMGRQATRKKQLVKMAYEIAPDDLWITEHYLKQFGDSLPYEEAVALWRRILKAMKAGDYYSSSGGNFGMIYQKIAEFQIRADKLDEAAATVRELVRDYPSIDSMSIKNLGYSMAGRGRRDLGKEFTLLAARHNAHLRPFAAESLVKELEKLGEKNEAYALCIRTLATWADNPEDERRHLDSMRAARSRLSAKGRWEDVFGPFLERKRAPLSPENRARAEGALLDLTSDEVEKRDRAARLLPLIGQDVVPLLREPASSGDPEVRARARAIVETLYVEDWR